VGVQHRPRAVADIARQSEPPLAEALHHPLNEEDVAWSCHKASLQDNAISFGPGGRFAPACTAHREGAVTTRPREGHPVILRLYFPAVGRRFRWSDRLEYAWLAGLCPANIPDALPIDASPHWCIRPASGLPRRTSRDGRGMPLDANRAPTLGDMHSNPREPARPAGYLSF
jgi:hypothetical protein